VTYKEACGKKCELGADSLTNTSSESEEMERKMPDNGGASKYCFQVDKSKSDSGTFCLNSLTSHHVKNKMDNFFDMSFKAFHICLLFLSNLFWFHVPLVQYVPATAVFCVFSQCLNLIPASGPLCFLLPQLTLFPSLCAVHVLPFLLRLGALLR
jgi:hypothetical protein